MTNDLVGCDWLAQKTRKTRAQHSIQAFLIDEAGAKHDWHIRTDLMQASECFLAVHERHGEIEKNEVEAVRAATKNVQAIEARLGGDDMEARLGESSLHQGNTISSSSTTKMF